MCSSIFSIRKLKIFLAFWSLERISVKAKLSGCKTWIQRLRMTNYMYYRYIGKILKFLSSFQETLNKVLKYWKNRINVLKTCIIKNLHQVIFLYVDENQILKKFIILCQRVFSGILIWKIGVKMNLRLITKSYEAYPEKGFLTKSILQLFRRMCPFRQRERFYCVFMIPWR